MPGKLEKWKGLLLWVMSFVFLVSFEFFVFHPTSLAVDHAKQFVILLNKVVLGQIPCLVAMRFGLNFGFFESHEFVSIFKIFGIGSAKLQISRPDENVMSYIIPF